MRIAFQTRSGVAGKSMCSTPARRQRRSPPCRRLRSRRTNSCRAPPTRAAPGRLESLVPLLFHKANPRPFNYCLWRQGLVHSPECRLPLTQVSPELAAALDRAMDLLALDWPLHPSVCGLSQRGLLSPLGKSRGRSNDADVACSGPAGALASRSGDRGHDRYACRDGRRQCRPARAGVRAVGVGTARGSAVRRAGLRRCRVGGIHRVAHARPKRSTG
jgi:hypothetical protein